MNHTTAEPALPESDPFAVIRQRIALARRRLDNLFSKMMLEVAWYPFKPSRETFSQIQMEMDQMPTKEIKLEMWSGGLYAVGLPLPEGIASPQYFKTLRSSWIHQHGIGGAQVLIILTIMGARFLWERRGPDRRFWSRALWVEGLVEAFQDGVAGKL